MQSGALVVAGPDMSQKRNNPREKLEDREIKLHFSIRLPPGYFPCQDEDGNSRTP